MLVARKLSSDTSVSHFIPNEDLVSRLKHKFRARRIYWEYEYYRNSIPQGYEPFSDDRTPYAGELNSQLPSADIINLHWIAGLLDHRHFFARVPRHTPLVWRLADMAPLTGGCHYDHNCGRFTHRCGACPQLGSTDEHDLSREIWQRKNQALRSLRPGQLHIVGTSHWIAEQAHHSSLLNEFPITVIPNGLDTDEFAPRDKMFSRDLWNIPRDARVVLFAAESIVNRRKGLAHLIDAMSMIKDIPRLLLVSVGGGKLDLDSDVPHLPLGRINNDRTLSTIYSAADIYVIPSLQESFGQTVIESLACGTPVIGFDTGGIPDMVRPNQTGWLCPVASNEALASAIRTALASDLKHYSTLCRQIAVSEYSLEVQARAYTALYSTLVGARLVSPSFDVEEIRATQVSPLHQ